MVVVSVAVLACLSAAWLAGFIGIGEPCAGTWKVPGGDVPGNFVIRHTDAGYGFAVLIGAFTNRWFPLKHDRNTLTFVGRVQPNGQTTEEVVGWRFVFQPWSGHLIEEDLPPSPDDPAVALDKVSNDTILPTPPATEHPSP